MTDKILNPNSSKYRIQTINDITKNMNLNPMVDYNNTMTEYYTGQIGRGRDEKSSSSNTTKKELNKKFQSLETILKMGTECNLDYIKSGTTGHVFKLSGKLENGNAIECAIKIVAYTRKDEDYGGIYDVKRPENAEQKMTKVLSYFVVKDLTPHIILPVTTFYTDLKKLTNFFNTKLGIVKKKHYTEKEHVYKLEKDDNELKKKYERYLEFLDNYDNEEYHKKASIMISEWANRGDLLDFLRHNYDDPSMTLEMWRVIFFQVLSVLAVILDKYPNFRHNDLKANNLLIHKIDSNVKTWRYPVGNMFFAVPNIQYMIKLVDFDFSCIPNIVENSKVEHSWTNRINVHSIQNQYYDIHYFFSTLIMKGFCPNIMTSSKVPTDVKEFINRVIPEKYRYSSENKKVVDKKGRILINDEYTTPIKILSTDPFFEPFRKNKISSKKEKKTTNSINILNYLKNSEENYEESVTYLISKLKK